MHKNTPLDLSSKTQIMVPNPLEFTDIFDTTTPTIDNITLLNMPNTLPINAIIRTFDEDGNVETIEQVELERTPRAVAHAFNGEDSLSEIPESSLSLEEYRFPSALHLLAATAARLPRPQERPSVPSRVWTIDEDPRDYVHPVTRLYIAITYALFRKQDPRPYQFVFNAQEEDLDDHLQLVRNNLFATERLYLVHTWWTFFELGCWIHRRFEQFYESAYTDDNPDAYLSISMLASELDLSQHQLVVADRVFKLFGYEHRKALHHMRYIKVEELKNLSNDEFDALQRKLQVWCEHVMI